MSLRVGERNLLVVARGDARLDNRKLKSVFGGKAKMLDAEQVLALTGHPVGGVCPFGLATPLPVYCDVSLRAFDDVIPAAGGLHTAVRIAPERMAALVGAELGRRLPGHRSRARVEAEGGFPSGTPGRVMQAAATPRYSQTVGSHCWQFRDLKEVMAKATPLRSGDVLAGIAAGSAVERMAARMCLADVPLQRFLDEALIPYESDEVTRLIIDSHDAAAFAPRRAPDRRRVSRLAALGCGRRGRARRGARRASRRRWRRR